MPVPVAGTQYPKHRFKDRGDEAPVGGRARFVALAGVVTLAVSLAGCQTNGLGDITGSIGGGGREVALPASEPELRSFAEQWGHKYDRDPANKQVAMTYARALRALDEHTTAVAVLQRLAAQYPKDFDVLGAYGKALADAGRLQEAAEVLQHAHAPERPNWSILSAQGSVADQLGDHARAQEYYDAALKIVPNQPQVLSNLGLSYALSKQLPRAEETLQRAAVQPVADVRVRQNLALVLALEGKFGTAQEVLQRDLSPIDAAGNVSAIRQMIAQSNTWNEIRKLDHSREAHKTPREPKKTQTAEVKAGKDARVSADADPK
ncbi:MAG: tetratricopeptide repeat protein [Beijerinckiaceae bacterium]